MLLQELRRLAPEGLFATEDQQPGWSIDVAGIDAWRSRALGDGDVEWFADSSPIRIVEQIRVDVAHGAVTSQLTLQNISETDALHVAELFPAFLRIAAPQERLIVRTAGGGLTDVQFPPTAYREHLSVLEGTRLNGGPIARSGTDGRSSNHSLPVFQLHADGGGVISALEWSGPWLQRVSELAGESVLQAHVPTGQIALEPGEVLTLPRLHLVVYHGDLHVGGNAFRRYVYNAILPDLGGRQPLPPLSYDHWFGIGCDISDTSLRRQVDRAAEIGLEYFVVDAGWYAGCESGYDFSPGTGNWEIVDDRKFPDGLESLAAYVRSKGLQPGLWFEVERGHRTSHWVREHPDWYFDTGGEYLHLNLALPAVQQHVIMTIGGYIERLQLKWSRWDYNIGPLAYWNAADPSDKLPFLYMEGLYRVLDTLMSRFPDWLIECCASGGRRIDLGTLRRAHTTWMSDHTHDADICRAMQTGFARFLPGTLANSSVAVAREEGDAGFGDRDVVSRMVGALSFDGDIASWSTALTERVAQLVERYASIRHLLVQDFYPLTPQARHQSDVEIVQFTDHHGHDSVIFGFGPSHTSPHRIHPRGLDPTVTFVADDLLVTGSGKRYMGATLLEEGLDLPFQADGVALYRLRLSSH